MTITVNGKIVNMNLGCRTFTTISRLLELLKVEGPISTFKLNGQPIDRIDFPSTTAKAGDKIAFTVSSTGVDTPSVA